MWHEHAVYPTCKYGGHSPIDQASAYHLQVVSRRLAVAPHHADDRRREFFKSLLTPWHFRHGRDVPDSLQREENVIPNPSISVKPTYTQTKIGR